MTEAELDGRYGVTLFDRRAVFLERGLSSEMWGVALMHELVHLIRGPVPREQADAEEQQVRLQTAQTLVPDGHALALLDHIWTPDEIRRVAEHYGTDECAVRDAINPPTQPLPVITPVVPAQRGPGRTADPSAVA